MHHVFEHLTDTVDSCPSRATTISIVLAQCQIVPRGRAVETGSTALVLHGVPCGFALLYGWFNFESDADGVRRLNRQSEYHY